MNRSRSVSETSVGLFAFLDVLMSTMGSLILVLMVVTPKIRQEAVAKAAVTAQRAVKARRAIEVRGAVEKAPPPYVPPPVIELPRETVDLNAKLKVELAELSQETQERRRIADDKHEALVASQAKLQKNQAELDELERRLAQILRAKSRLAESVTKVSSEGITTESQLAGAAARLRTLRGQIAHASTMYTFVAYDGVSGTTRHPILIECTREHIKFLQEGVSLSSSDVSGYSPTYNPVQAGAQALVDYWAAHSAPGDPRPYVLLVVRPSGTVAYYTARRLLERMKDPFGYELLPDDQKLDIPPAVPEAAEACRKAVAKAIAERVDVFKQVFDNGTGIGRGNKLAGSGAASTGTSHAERGAAPSPFDDLGDSSSGGSKPAGQNAANTSGDGQPAQPRQPNEVNSQPGQSGTNSGPAVTQSEPGFAGNGTGQAGSLGDATSGASAPGSPKSGTPTPGTGISGDRQPGVMLSDTGALATGRTSGESTGTSMLGIGTPATGSSAANGSGAGGPDGGPSIAGGFGAGLQGPNGSRAGGPGGGSPDAGVPGGGSSTGSPAVGSPGGGSLLGGSPGTGLSGAGSPRTGTPTTGTPGSGSSGGDSSESGFASLGVPAGTAGQGPAAGVTPSQSEFPPSIIPRSGGGESSSLESGSERLSVGHPTPGVAGNDSSDGQPQSQTGQSGGLGSGSFASGSQSDSTQLGTTQPGSAPAGSTQAGPAQAGSPGSGADQMQSPESGMPPAGSSGQPESGQGGGSPSFGSSSSSSSGGDEGQSGSGSDAPPGAKAMDGLPSFSTSSEDDGAPRRANQQTTHRWGISSPRSSIGFEHEVMVYIEAGRIYVGGQPPIGCGRGETVDRLSLAVLRALDREARMWGRPRENFYWVPTLKIVICPGGVLQFERIQPALLRHGLTSTVDYRLELSRPRPLPRLVTE